ncbi:transporter [Bdellovibrio bacteriovorus]|uniref:Transporter n=1 Tax=Bdellovibrio bacteriovorus TaxID=959 RepID=A0A150WN52_BDEBC|nr:TolC family protein [Bdellovibrio bacteriovorus]KYG65911.1 transporter [Bdellovibrio bacteriovorus]
MVFIIALFLSQSAHAIGLDQAVQSSLQKNEVVGQSKEQVVQVEELKKQATGSVLPTIALEGSYLIQPEVSDPIAAEFFPDRQTTANVSLNQPLFRGLREFAAIRRQNSLVAAQKQTFMVEVMALYQKVADSYMEVLSLEQDIRNIEAQRGIYQDRVKDLQARSRRGESSGNEAFQAQSTSAALDAEFQIQSGKLKTARENFAFLTGLPVDTKLDDVPENVVMTLQPLSDYLAKVEDRPDVKVKKQQTEASNEEVSFAKGAHWPTLDLTANYYLIRPEGFTEDLKWDVLLKMKLPLYEGGTTQSKVREAASKRAGADLALNEARRKAEAEIKSLHESLRLRADQIKYLKLSAELAEKNYKFLLRDSRRGLARSTDVQVGLTEYRGQKRAYDAARYQAQLERIRLDLASANIPSILTKELE